MTLRDEWGIHYDLVRRVARGEDGVPREIARRIRSALGSAAPEPRTPRAVALDELIALVEPLRVSRDTRRRELDHVPATTETVARRALWLDETWDLDGAHVVFLGDRDLTSVALRAVRPSVRTTVVDIDPDVCERAGHSLFADLRLGLPRSLIAAADLVFTDPPYTPTGVALFARRGVQALRSRDLGRIVIAYGFGIAHPGLGLKVQQALSNLALVYEAILPGFNAYEGAEALGSRSDMYVVRPTAKTPAGSWTPPDARIYTHGAGASEGAPLSGGLAAYLEDVRTGGKPPFSLPHSGDVELDLTGWESSVLPVMLSANATTLTLRGRIDLHRIEDVLAARWTLTRVPGGVRLERREVEGVLGRILDHPRALVANAWRDAIAPPLTKNEARAIVGDGWQCHVDELPPHRLRELHARTTASASVGSP